MKAVSPAKDKTAWESIVHCVVSFTSVLHVLQQT